MLLRNLSPIMAGIGLVAVVAISGCKTTGCSSCQQTYAPQPCYSYYAQQPECPTCNQGYAPSATPVYQYEEPMPVQPHGTPQPPTRVAPPLPMPNNSQPATIPPRGLESGGSASANPWRLEVSQARPNYDSQVAASQYQPVAQPVESRQQLMPQQKPTRRIIRPVRGKVKSMYQSMKTRLAKWRHNVRNTLANANTSNPTGTTKKNTSRMTASVSQGADPFGVPQRTALAVELMSPDFSKQPTLVTASRTVGNVATQTRTTSHEVTFGTNASGDYIPKQSHPSAMGFSGMHVPANDFTGEPIKNWPYKSFSKRKEPKRLSSVPSGL